MSESLVLGVVALVGVVAIVAIVAIVAFGLARGSFYGWRRRRVSVNTVQPTTTPDCVTQAQLQDLEKRLAANQANVDRRLAAIDGRLGTLESTAANHSASIADLRGHLTSLLNRLFVVERAVRDNRTSCNLRHAAQIVYNNVVNNLVAFISGLVAWLCVAVFGWPVIGWFNAIFIAGPLVAIGVGHLSGWFASWFIDWRRDRRQVGA